MFMLRSPRLIVPVLSADSIDDRLLAVSSTSFLNVSELQGDTQVPYERDGMMFIIVHCLASLFAKRYADIFPG